MLIGLVPDLRWEEVPKIIGLTPTMLVRCAVTHANQRPSGYSPSIEDLAEYLDLHHFKGILRATADKYLVTVRPLLEECLPCDDATLNVLGDPCTFFNTAGHQTARDRIVEYFEPVLNKKSPEHAKRAMVAHIEFGLGNYRESLVEAQFADNEKATPDFAKILYASTAAAWEATKPTQIKTAEILIPLIGEFRRKDLAKQSR